ncbi:MAG: hypothetical protein NT003_00490, partial [Candidatus Magasanikbacteria bacterium]|nr:hypothetical protein [Candidatus Magasanikbacteria bacterium]
MEPKFLKSEDVDFKEIPTEWRTVAALAKELNITGHFINTRIKKYSATHPEWSKKYIANGIVRDCLHPDLIKYIVEEFNNRGEQPPEGWITISKLRNKYGIAERTMEGFIEKYSQDHPGMDISARYLNSIGKLALFVHPDVAIYVDGLMQDRKTKIVPPGWFSNRTLAEKIGVAQTTVFRIAQGYRESNPEWFNFFLNQDKKSFEYYHPDLVAIVKNEIVGRRKEIPPGWLLIADIITVCGAQHGVPDYNFIYQVASEFRKTNPEYFGFYTAKNGKFLEFYHPDLVKIISERFRSRLTVKQEVKEIVIKKRKEVEKKRIEREGVDLAPMGWLTLNKLIVVLRTGPQIIASIVDAYRSDHPDWFKVFQYKKGGSGEHFHPDLVKRLEEDLRSRGEHPPEGWRTASDILDDFPIARKSFEELMKSFRISHPEWIHNYLNRLNQLVEHLHPALVKELGMLISQRGDSAPRGWLTIGAVANKLNVTFATVMHVVDKYRLSNSGWIKKYLNSSNNLYEHIHPDLIKEVEKKLSSRQKPPVGWESLNDLRRLFKFDPSTLENFYKKYEKTHPEWRKIFLNENGKMVPYWHPDFILLFKETFTSRQKAPSGWKTLGPVAQELDISPQTVESLMERFRDLHPEWFKEYLNKGKNFYEHFHPDLINELKKILFDKNKIITAGWKKMGDLSREFGVSYTFLQKFILPYRTSNPDWIFKDKIKDRAIIYEYYHPDLIKIIKDAIKLREKPPSGWKTRNKIFSELGLSSGAESVHRFIVAQLKEHPEWAHRYLDSVGKLAEYLHPELVRLVVEHVGVRNEAPSGWLEKITLVHELKLNHGTILNFIQKYRTTRPEWFVPYLNKEKRLVEFLHPELVELIRAHYIFKKRYVFEKKDD